MFTAPVHHTCSVANQVRACDLHRLCCVCSLAIVRMLKFRATVHVHANFLSFTCGKHADTCMY